MKRLASIALLLALTACGTGEQQDMVCKAIFTPAQDQVCVPAVDPEGRELTRIKSDGVAMYWASVWRYDSEEARFFRAGEDNT